MNVNSASYSELRSYIKQERPKNPSFWGDYTHFTTEELRSKVRKYQGTNSTPVIQEVVKQQQNVTQDVSVHEVIDILVDAVDKLKRLPSYANEKELKALHAKAMEIEFELSN